MLPSPPLLDWSIAQWRASPAFNIEDAYKWLYQATLGGEHGAGDVQMARSWLHEEWKTLSLPVSHEKMTVSLRPDGRVVRLNLRAFKAAGGTETEALDLYIRSAQGFRGNRLDFLKAWEGLAARLHQGPVGRLRYTDWAHLDRLVRRKFYPAIDHSAAYEVVNHPSYRVVLGSLATLASQRKPAKMRVSP